MRHIMWEMVEEGGWCCDSLSAIIALHQHKQTKRLWCRMSLLLRMLYHRINGSITHSPLISGTSPPSQTRGDPTIVSRNKHVYSASLFCQEGAQPAWTLRTQASLFHSTTHSAKQMWALKNEMKLGTRCIPIVNFTVSKTHLISNRYV